MFRYILVFLVSMALSSSCSRDHNKVMSVLVAADSLLDINPQRSLDMIDSLDSLQEMLDRREKAYRDYIFVSARYKCYYPVANDTAIFSAVDYFRRRGPEKSYAKALMMQGAVQFEQNRMEEALESYKSAETVFEEEGSYLDLGLLNSRIGELYRLSYVNDSASVYRFGKALQYFRLSGDKRRIAASSLDYARSVMSDSLDMANEMILNSLDISREINDASLILYACELLTYIEGLRNDHLKYIERANVLLSEIRKNNLTSLNDNTYNDLYFKLSESYVELGMRNEALEALSNVVMESATDSLLYYYAQERIAKLDSDWRKAYLALERSDELYDDIVAKNYDKRLVEAELRYDLTKAQEEFYRRQNKNLVMIILLLLGLSALAAIALIARNSLKERNREIVEYSHKLLLAEKELNEAIRRLNAIDGQVENQRRGNMELQKLSGELMNIINEIGYVYEINRESSNPVRVLESVKRQIEDSLSLPGFKDKARSILDISYPGMLDRIFAEAKSALTDEEKWIIILMCCNFETNTICLFSENSVTQLNNKKSRISKKLQSQERLSKYLDRRMREFISEDKEDI